MAKRKASLSTAMAFMSEEAQDEIRERAGVLAPLPIETILPDPAQPRQLLPVDLMQALISGVIAPAAVLQAWVDRAATDDAPPSLQRHVQELRRLADSIAQHGLINPISVRRAPAELALPSEVKYLIITGERRYWAHVLLTTENRQIQEGVETTSPDRIKATVASEGISVRAHQIIENLLREDIDAVEKANGFLALRLELSGVSPDATGEDRNHGSGLVRWRQVEKALGVSDRYRRYVVAVRKLSPEAQGVIQQHGLTERMVRPISQKLHRHPELQVKALQKVASWQQEATEGNGPTQPLTASVEKLVDTMLARATRMPQEQKEPAPVSPQQLHSRVKSTLRLLTGLDDAEMLKLAEALSSSEGNIDFVKDLESLQQQLTALLQEIAAQRQTED